MKTLATMAFAASLATFADEPPALPRPATIVRDIAYAPENGAFGLCDLWLPASPQPDGAALPSGQPPVVLLIHGGGWSALDRASVAGIAVATRRSSVRFPTRPRLRPWTRFP